MTKPTQDKETLREAVCKAIVNAHGGYYPKADAAIATMFERLRNVSQGMLDSAFDKRDEHMEDIWQAMLDKFQQENSECPSCGGLNTSCPRWMRTRPDNWRIEFQPTGE